MSTTASNFGLIWLLAWMPLTLASLGCWLAIVDEVEKDLPPSERPSWAVFDLKMRFEMLSYLRQHRQRYPSSRLRRWYYITQAAAFCAFVGPLVLGQVGDHP